MNFAPIHSHDEPTEDGSDVSGNVPDFRDYEDFNRNPRPLPILGTGIAKGDGSRTSHLDTFDPNFGQQVPRRDENSPQSTFNIDSGKSPCWISIELLRINVWHEAGPEER